MFSRTKVVVLTGAGVSAESGLPTFRDGNGLWNNVPVERVATPAAWVENPSFVLAFYNKRRADAAAAKPNDAHRAIALLESKFDVVVVTQNIDDLHERAGSTCVLHLHGELCKARSSIDPTLIYDIGSALINLGDRCPLGGQLRPQIVWFGEEVMRYHEAAEHVRDAAKVLVVGSSLSVFPAAGLLDEASSRAEKVVVNFETVTLPYGFKLLRGKAGELVPGVVKQWLE
jgi:NAD-dependent deacetylase